ncbi:MAG: hypothetical protein Q9195_006608 [Heterodermia aff. obscurata]
MAENQYWLSFHRRTRSLSGKCNLVTAAVSLETAPVRIHYLALYTFLGDLIIILTLVINILGGVIAKTHNSLKALRTWLLVTQIAVAFVQGTSAVLIPRRPNVFHQGKAVDSQHSVSFASRVTFTWAAGLLQAIVRHKTLDLDDLPKLTLDKRSQTLHSSFEQHRRSLNLWKALVRTHIRALTYQYILSLFTCALSFGPQIALYRILKSLEHRQLAPNEVIKTWAWVGALGTMMLLTATVDSWLWWTMYSELGVPIYQELVALVFAKSMRRSIANTTRNTKEVHPQKHGVSADEDNEGKNRNFQNIVNLTAVDTRRIADFVAFSHLVPFSILKLVLSCSFLVRLTGWESVLAGLGVAALIAPVSTLLARRYSAMQNELMKASDKRIAALTEALRNFRQIKLSASEEQWGRVINSKRNSELQWLWKASCYKAASVSMWILGPLLLSVTTLITYALIHGELPASIAFTAVSIFASLETAISSLPDAIFRGIEAKISADRIDLYMGSSENRSVTSAVSTIAFQNATIAWLAVETAGQRPKQGEYNNRQRFLLQHISLVFPPKSLTVIAGKTASGKSLLLASIIGECDVLAGEVLRPHSPSNNLSGLQITDDDWVIDTAVAYVAQDPWIANATIRDNILFGLPYERSRYQSVIHACRFEAELIILPEGDMTYIGANGINLSGGQRWRLCFARALYSRAGILVLDDIFSALDAHTRLHLYEHGLTGPLAENRTRILATHHLSLCLSRAAYCVILDDGTTKFAGSVETLKQTENLTNITSPPSPDTDRATSREGRDILENPAEAPDTSSAAQNSQLSRADGGPKGKKFSEEEKRTGSTPLSVYTTYILEGKQLPWWILAILTYATYTTLILVRSWWVNVWTSWSTSREQNAHHSILTTTRVNIGTANAEVPGDMSFYLGIYVAISLIACIVGTARLFVLARASLGSSRVLFRNLLSAVLRAPLQWSDTVPLGRILNRFTSDLYMIDLQLNYDLGNFVAKVLEFLAILAAGVLLFPPLAVVALILLVLCIKLCLNFLKGARVIQRLESVARSPLFELIDSSLAGITTIRAYGKTRDYSQRMYFNIDRHAEAIWNLWLLNRWLGYRLQIVGAIFSTATAGVAVYFPTISAAMAGFAMSFALQYNFALAMALRFYANLDMGMNAADRVIEFCKIETESLEGQDPPAAWPTEGRVEVCNLTVSYAPDLPPVLNGLSLRVEKGQWVGIVGRTAAGKSSLALALFRFLEAQGGHIKIDGIDISKLTLSGLRSRLAILPQQPVLFSGTIRSNLDPFGEHSDMELYQALEQVHLIAPEDVSTALDSSKFGSLSEHDRMVPFLPFSRSHASHSDDGGSSSTKSSLSGNSEAAPMSTNARQLNPFASLSTSVSEGGNSFSHGQRQLICLARAILSRPKILVLDEATSAVDMETAAIIQQSLRGAFSREKGDTTLLVIAHRLSSIADFDRIMVMDKGQAVEFGKPRDLLQAEGGVFKEMVRQSGEKGLVESVIYGKEAGM